MTNQAVPLADEALSTEITFDEPRFPGFVDLYQGIGNFPLWSMLGWNDIRQRYRRSALGPFWITLSTAVFIALLGVIYSRIFNQDIATYLPFIAVGLICWGFISGTTIESCVVYIEGTAVIKQVRLPYSIYPLRMIWRSFIVFLHTAVLLIPIGLIFGVDIGLHTLLALPGLALLMANQLWLAIVIGVISTRYRDINPLVQAAIQISMFATPIMWPVNVLGNARIIADVNPIYHLIQIVRAPLLGEPVMAESWLVVGGMCVVGYGLAAILLGRAHKRLVYWL